MTRERDDTKEIVSEILEKVSLLLAPYAPYISEYIYQMFEKGESVHLCSWPKADKKLIDEKLEEEFKIALLIIEKGLYSRDKVQIGLKWPLAKAIIKCNKKISKELQELVKTQLNIKSIEIKVDEKEISVELNTEMTPELEAEGYAREISRKVQAARKNAGFVKSDVIKLGIIIDESISKLIEKHKEFIKERVNAKNIEIGKVKESDYKNKVEDKIKGKAIKILFNKV